MLIVAPPLMVQLASQVASWVPNTLANVLSGVGDDVAILAAVEAIADRHAFEFRRPCTIAKGGDTCEFRFYRKGTAPDIELIEGVPLHWNESLNR